MPGNTRLSDSGAHRRCARCGKVVSRRALNCRRCGKQQRVNPRTAMLLVSGLFLIALFSFATVGPRVSFGRLLGDAPAASPVASAPAPVSASASTSPSDGATMTAAELWAAYGESSTKADARFKGKMVAITGTVADLRRDFHGRVMLRLGTGDSLEKVRAVLDTLDENGRSIPVRGQMVSLRCTGRGTTIGSPLLDGCSIL